MTDIPTYDPNQVALRPTSTARRTGPSDVAQAAPGRALQGLGQSLDRTADVARQIADSQAETRVREADIAMSTRIQEELLTGDKALMKMQGQAFVDNAPEYLKRIEDHARDLKSQPRNSLESRMLDDLTQRRLQQVRQQVNGQMIREAQFANKAAATARTDVVATDLAYNYRDPRLFRQYKSTLDAAVADQLNANGVSDPVSFQAVRQQKLGVVHTYAVQDMMRLGETGQAQSWLDKAIIDREIDPGVASQLQDRLEKATVDNEITALGEGQQPHSVVDGALTHVTPELEAAVRFQETRNLGGTAVSPKGAEGVMQVMPATGPEAARLAKVAWQPERMKSDKPEDVEYQQKLGNAYLDKQLKRFGGSVVAGLAAYNAGPEMVQDWIDGTNKTGKNKGNLKLGDPLANPRAWANAIPFTETKAYVAAITAKLGGSTKAPLPQTIMTVAEAETWVQQFPTKDRDKARATALGVVNRNRAAKNQREADAWDAAQPYLRDGQDWTKVPKQIWNRIDPVHQTSLMEVQRKGENRVTDPETLDGLMGIIETNPDGFKEMDLLKVAPDLSKSDFEQFRMLQHQARTGQGEWKRQTASYTTITRLAPGIVPPSMLKPGGKNDMATFKSRWYSAMQAKQDSQKEPLTDDEIAEIGTRLMAQTAMSTSMLGSKAQPLFKFGPEGTTAGWKAEYAAIPVEEQSKVFRFLQKRDGKVPTDAAILDTWRTLKATGDL